MSMRLQPGDTAPDFTFETPWEKGLKFSDCSKGKPAVLVFLRYYGCGVCQMDMANLKNEIGLFEKKEARLFVVLQSSSETVSSVTEKEVWPFTIICDQKSEVFRKYHVAPGGIIKYLHPAGLIAAIRATSKGYRHGKFEGHETQLPAFFVVDSSSGIKFAHYGNNIVDIPSPSAIASHL
jgi:thioredoxin-dependent peroxiredoxin